MRAISHKEKWILGIFSITRISKKLLATNEFQKNAQRKLFTQNSTYAYGKCSQNYEIMFMTAHKARTEFSDCLMHWVTFYKLLFLIVINNIAQEELQLILSYIFTLFVTNYFVVAWSSKKCFNRALKYTTTNFFSYQWLTIATNVSITTALLVHK